MIRIVTDSTSDVPESVARELDIVVVPAYVIFGMQSYRDGVTLSREEFYERLAIANPLPTTSSPSVGDFEDTYLRLKQEGVEHVISIHVAAKLSAILNAALSAAKAVPDLDVTVFDSEQVTMGLGWQVIEAARAAKAGKTVSEIIDQVQQVRKGAHVYAALDTLEYVRRSGRVGWARAMIGQLLRIKPIVEVLDGAVLSVDRVRTRAHSIERLKELVASHSPLRKLAVLHTRSLDAATKLADEFRALYPSLSDPIHIVEVTSTIGTHVGPNGMGVACVAAD
jgi:DegV family protein with EDD domain